MAGEWPTGLAVCAIAIAMGIYYTATAWFTHRERMAKIQMGIDPDHEGQLPVPTPKPERQPEV